METFRADLGEVTAAVERRRVVQRSIEPVMLREIAPAVPPALSLSCNLLARLPP